jgi:hypothetical protein
MTNHLFQQVSHFFEVGVGPVNFKHGEFRIVLPRNSFVPKISIQLENFCESADEQSFQIKLRRDAKKKIETERFVSGAERLGRRPARNIL